MIKLIINVLQLLLLCGIDSTYSQLQFHIFTELVRPFGAELSTFESGIVNGTYARGQTDGTFRYIYFLTVYICLIT